ncbi:GPI mannosyltransferase 4 [Thecamonas trahens ATCC 50062]|uniref:Mannosyltransferase n=1 Tax=Thecamonas trahens ATCC 50062 TaxID=461836 RepID=A0A0L0DLS7_THETB|nr:GPI mannosyltransferase 4 [Thecamonas trahens ATCC 50062]KNC52996.1 GPI mannosyltransferase 4 [Thecamonas trahens ATCC 50062]|eukprot:XP_013754883.1 GPI mannosyltransferase 4 [Thecamonas trahens ATCC 50062]
MCLFSKPPPLALVAALLLAAAVVSPSYLHPDEHHQTAELVAPSVLATRPHLPWEATAAAPLRSLYIPWLVAGLPWMLISAIAPSALTPSVIVAAPRIASALFIALPAHCCVMALARALSKDVPDAGVAGRPGSAASASSPRKASVRSTSQVRREGLRLRHRHSVTDEEPLASAQPPPSSVGDAHGFVASVGWLMATAWPVLIIGARPLANGVEAAAAAAALLTADRWRRRDCNASDIVPVAVVVALGIYLRPSFLGFAGGLALVMASWAGWDPKRMFGSVAVGLAVVAGVWLAAACGETLLYRYTLSDHTGHNYEALVVPPINFVAYNGDAASVASHGLHPRATHALVNTVMLFGPLWAMAGYGLAAGRQMSAGLRWVMVPALAFLCLLSIVPHQEPRFLAPMMASVAVLGAGAVQELGPIGRKRFWASWAVFNLATLGVFGVLHQGGVVPGAVWVASEAGPDATVVGFHTYMLPAHVIARSGARVVDLGGTGVSALVEALSRSGGRAFVLAPSTRHRLLSAPLV